jgi:glycosyltransferase involved in cell wall biosynthesis
LLIVGEFWRDKQEYLAQIDRLGIAQDVVIVDQYVPNEKVPIYFSAADVVVLPYIDVTQSGVVQLAFGFGVPVITTRVGGLPEVVVNGETGLLVTPCDSRLLAEAVCHYFAYNLGQQMSNAVKVASQQFGWRAITSVIERLTRDE